MRKQQSHTIHAQIDLMQNTFMLEPPTGVTLRAGDRAFWNEIIKSKALTEWTASQLPMAANLARCYADIERLQAELETQGDMIDGKLNPLHDLIEKLSRRAISITRVLQIHARAENGEFRDQLPKRQRQSEAWETKESNNIFNLLA
jgi:hypothetical protein